MEAKFNRRHLLAGAVGMVLTGCAAESEYVYEPEGELPTPTPVTVSESEPEVREEVHYFDMQEGYLLPVAGSETERRYGHPNFDAGAPLPEGVVLTHDVKPYFTGTERYDTYSTRQVYHQDREYVFHFSQSDRPPVQRVYLLNSRGDSEVGDYEVVSPQWRDADEVFQADHLSPEDTNNSVFSFSVKTEADYEWYSSPAAENVRRVMDNDHSVVLETVQSGIVVRDIYRLNAP